MASDKLNEVEFKGVLEESPELAEIGALPQEQPPAVLKTRHGDLTYVVQGSLASSSSSSSSSSSKGDSAHKTAIVTYHDLGLDCTFYKQTNKQTNKQAMSWLLVWFVFSTALILLSFACCLHSSAISLVLG